MYIDLDFFLIIIFLLFFKDPLVPDIARQYKQDREAYNTVCKRINEIIKTEFIIQSARQWTQKYAM